MKPTWTHEKLSLYHADCMEVMRQFPDKHFDLAIVDPPYGIGAENHAGKAENGWTQWDKKAWDALPPSSEYFTELFRVSQNQIIWGANYYSQNLPPSMGWIVWDKGQRDFSLADGELAYSSFNRALRIYPLSRAGAMSEGKRIHPTQKPVALYRWLLAKYAQPGQRILDTHLGSGSHAIAAHYAGMDFTGIELDADYFKAACERIERETSQMTLSL